MDFGLFLYVFFKYCAVMSHLVLLFLPHLALVMLVWLNDCLCMSMPIESEVTKKKLVCMWPNLR